MSVCEKTTELFLEGAVTPLPGVANGSEFTSAYHTWLLLLHASVEKRVSALV